MGDEFNELGCGYCTGIIKVCMLVLSVLKRDVSIECS